MYKSLRMARRVGSLVLTASLVAAGAVTLTGCSPDARIALIEQEVQTAMTAVAPNVIGVRSGDVATALKNAGSSSQVMVPVMVADLSTANAPVTAQAASSGPYSSVDDAAQMLGDSGFVAWQAWMAANPDGVEYVQTDIPATLSSGSNNQTSVTLDQDALQTFAAPFADADTQLFVQTAEASPEWQQEMVYLHADDFVSEVSGLPASVSNLAQLETVEPDSGGTFAVTISSPDPTAVVQYQVTQALKDYGTGKIWGGVSRSEFESKADGVTDIPDSAAPPVTTQAKVTVTSTGDGTYSADQSLTDNLVAQADRYKVAVVPDSYQAPTGVDAARTKAVDDAMKQLDKQVIKKQSLPGTKTLVAGGSGRPFTVKSVHYSDVHITFFKWGTNTQVVSVFVRSGKNLSFRVPVGSYRIVLATGSTWYGPKYSFGPTGYYEEFKNSPGSSTAYKYTAKANQTSTLTLGSTAGGAGVPSGTVDNPFAS